MKRRPSDLHRAFEMRFDDLRSPPIAIDLDRYNSADERSRLIAGLHLSSFKNTCVDRRLGGPRVHRIDA